MDISELKETLGEEKFTSLEGYINDLSGQRDSARKESIEGRKSLKNEVETLRTIKQRLFEKLGLDDDADIDSLPDSKGQAEAAKQYESKVKRLERELLESSGSVSSLSSRIKEMTLESALEKAISAHDWIDRDVALMLSKSAIKWEDDTPLYEADGKLMALADGVKFLAGAKPHLLKSAGAGGSGFRQKGAMPEIKNPWSKESLNLTLQGKILTDDPAMAARLKAAAN